MHRTQLYLEDDLWEALKLRSRESGVSMSELVREAVRGRYLGDAAKRKRSLAALAGLWKDRTDIPDTEAWIRSMRKDSRRDRTGGF